MQINLAVTFLIKKKLVHEREVAIDELSAGSFKSISTLPPLLTRFDSKAKPQTKKFARVFMHKFSQDDELPQPFARPKRGRKNSHQIRKAENFSGFRFS